MEGLWLLTIGLVPIVFAPPDFMLFPDVPKVVLLRLFTGLMGLLWVVEWVLRPQNKSDRGDGALWTRFRTWLMESPAHWILAAATALILANVISTLLSPSISVSLWGSNPGRDGYGLYNTFSYYVLFLVIATRLRSRQQLWRLLAVIALSATVAAFYGIVQQYGTNPFDQVFNPRRVNATFGNPLFAGSFFSLAVTVSAGLGLAHILRTRSIVVGALWTIVIAVQLIGLTFTFSRGPTASLAIALSLWMALILFTVGKRVLLVAAILIGSATLILGGVFFGPGVYGSAEGFATYMRDAAAADALPATDGAVEANGRAFEEILGGPTGSAEANSAEASEEAPPTSTNGPTANAGKVSDALVSIATSVEPESRKPPASPVETETESLGEALSAAVSNSEFTETLDLLSTSFRVRDLKLNVKASEIGGRTPIWNKSIAVVLGRPWFEPEQRGNLIARHLFGYGPGMSRYTLPLHWDPGARYAVYASTHNYPLQILVDLGVIALASYAALIAAIILGATLHITRRRADHSRMDLVILTALSAGIIGKLAEQMTGVARVSDTTLFWAVAGAMTAMMLMKEAKAEDPSDSSKRPAMSSVWKLSLAALILIVGVSAVWQKNVPYAQSANLASRSKAAFLRDELVTSLDLMDQAIFKSPDVGTYYTLRSGMTNAFGVRDRSDEIDKATEIYAYGTLALDTNPLSHTAKGFQAASSMRLYQLGDVEKGDEAIRNLRDLVRMLPGHEPVYIQLATAHLILGQPNEAIAVLDEYRALTDGQVQPSEYSGYLRDIAEEELENMRGEATP